MEWDFAYISLVMVLMSVLVSYYAVKSIFRENPTDTIRSKVPQVSSSGLIEKPELCKHFSFNTRWNYRDTKRNKFRALIIIIGVIGCTALLVSAFGMYDGRNDLKELQFNQINLYEPKLVIDDESGEMEVDEMAEEVNSAKIMESAIEIESDSTKMSVTLLVLNHTDLITPTDYNWNRIRIADDEVSISQKIVDMLDVKIGDAVK